VAGTGTRPWRPGLRRLAGLILAGVFAIFRVAGAGLLSWVIAGLVAAILAWRAQLNPLILLAGGAVAFALGHGIFPTS